MQIVFMTKNILVVYSTTRDRRELNTSFFQQHYNIHFHHFEKKKIDLALCGSTPAFFETFSPEIQLQQLLKMCDELSIDGVVSTDDYPGSIFASAVAESQGLLSASAASVLNCQHKYYSRLLQSIIVDYATPEFRLIDPQKKCFMDLDLAFPVFVKPVKSYLSIFANRVANIAELENIVNTAVPSDLFLEQFNWFLKKYTDYPLTGNYLLAETILEGNQVTLEGYVYQGDVIIVGVVDSIMYPGTICFERFDYPSRLAPSIQERMAGIAKKFITGIKLENSFFNIELIHNPVTDQIHIIEINPRMASQFADLYEKVDGKNTYQTLLELAIGEKPEIVRKKGQFQVAASFVLRVFSDKRVKKIPGNKQLENFYEIFPDARVEIHVKEDEYLSSVKQDGKSFRYALIHLGANDQLELMEKFALAKRMLAFDFE